MLRGTTRKDIALKLSKKKRGRLKKGGNHIKKKKKRRGLREMKTSS